MTKLETGELVIRELPVVDIAGRNLIVELHDDYLIYRAKGTRSPIYKISHKAVIAYSKTENQGKGIRS